MNVAIIHQPGMRRTLFNWKGEVLSLPEPKRESFDSPGPLRVPELGIAHEYMMVYLSPGIYWLLSVSDAGVSVRYYVITDEYPVSARETLETDIPTDFLFGAYTAAEVRTILERHIKRTKKDAYRYPPQLVDAIVEAVAQAKQRV